MKPTDLESMSVDELWSLRALLIAVLTGKMSAEKAKIDRQLRQLGLGAAPNNSKKIPHARRAYPQVFPKYSNPAKPSETWAGRGKQPRWLTAQHRKIFKPLPTVESSVDALPSLGERVERSRIAGSCCIRPPRYRIDWPSRIIWSICGKLIARHLGTLATLSANGRHHRCKQLE